jgi:phage terminase large subunit
VTRQTIKYADYRPYGAAREFFTCHAPEVVLAGPAGTGKTRSALERIHAVAEKYAGCRILLARKTRSSLQNTALVTYNQLVLPYGAAKVNYQGAAYPNGSVIDFGGLDKSSKIMSSEYDIVYIPEATELTLADWEAITTRLRWNRLPYQQLIADCNPAQPKHWLKLRANAGTTLMLESRHEDNPALWDAEANGGRGAWTREGAAYIAKLDKLSGARYLRLRKGIWAAAEGMIYEQWDPAVHLIDRFDIPAEWKRYWVIDFGFTNPFVFQAWAEDPDGRLFRYREIYRTKTLVEDHAQAIRLACLGEPYPVAIICDHDAEDRATLEKHLGLYTVAAFKSVSPGIQAAQRRMRAEADDRPRLFLLRDSLVAVDQDLKDAHKPTCTEEEIDSYVWASGRAGRVGDVPVKQDDHGCDALRYVVAFADAIARDPAEEKETFAYDARYQISPV